MAFPGHECLDLQCSWTVRLSTIVQQGLIHGQHQRGLRTTVLKVTQLPLVDLNAGVLPISRCKKLWLWRKATTCFGENILDCNACSAGCWPMAHQSGVGGSSHHSTIILRT